MMERLVAVVHMTEAPPMSMYASIVSRKTTILALAITALNAVKINDSDILNAYVTTTVQGNYGHYLGQIF